MTGRRTTVRNAFNRLATQPDDPVLRQLAAEISDELERRVTNTAVCAVIDMNIPAGKLLRSHCKRLAYTD